MTGATLKPLAAALDRARTDRSRIAKERAIASALRDIASERSDRDLATAARIASGRVLPVGDGRTLGVGGSLLLQVVESITGFDAEVIVACARAAGELAEAFAHLSARAPGAAERSGLPLGDVARLADALAAEPARPRKRALLEKLFADATPVETKYLAKALSGEMRIGAHGGVVQGAIGRAFGAPAESVRRAAALVTDPGDLAILARDHALDGARLLPGRPLAFMLATPIETLASAVDPGAVVVEDKMDGVRAQAHRTQAGEIAIFARGLDRVTRAFPEIVDALRRSNAPFVVDGEIVAVAPSGRPRPFQSLQARLNKAAPDAGDRTRTPVALVAFDLLADATGSLLALPWRERRSRLDAWMASLPPSDALAESAVRRLPSGEPLQHALDAEFSAARRRGHEGLVLKRADAPYEAGHRGRAWIKVKRAHATLDAVVVAAEEGHGRRAGMLSDYTFAVWRGDDLVAVGKAYSGLADAELEAMTRRLEATTVERRGALRIVRPEIVLEVAFDGVQRSSLHESGFALRFARITRIRGDKTPEQADCLAAVEAIFAAQVASGHRESGAGRSRRTLEAKRARARRRAAAARSQLSLFGDDS